MPFWKGNKYSVNLGFIDKQAKTGWYATVPGYIKANMGWKSNSGNQAVFRYQVVKELTMSAQVKELFAIAKYGCCCCVEERSWITALGMLGYRQQGLQLPVAMFQVWGGGRACKGSIRNAVLNTKDNVCFLLSDATIALWYNGTSILPPKAPKDFCMHGENVWDALVQAKQKGGFLFARKFQSTNMDSMELLTRIQTHFHNDNNTSKSQN